MAGPTRGSTRGLKGFRLPGFSRIMIKCYGERGILRRRRDICAVRDSCLRYVVRMDLKFQEFTGPAPDFSAKQGCSKKIELKPGPLVQGDFFVD